VHRGPFRLLELKQLAHEAGKPTLMIATDKARLIGLDHLADVEHQAVA
jgi:hypothetical protein